MPTSGQYRSAACMIRQQYPQLFTAALLNIFVNCSKVIVIPLQGCCLTGRAIARILHGVASPAFPTKQWTKCGFWQQYTNVDFAQIAAIAQHEVDIVQHNKEAAGDTYE